MLPLGIARLNTRPLMAEESISHTPIDAVARLVGIEGGVVSGVFNLESSGVEAPDWRPRHVQLYHEVRLFAAYSRDGCASFRRLVLPDRSWSARSGSRIDPGHDRGRARHGTVTATLRSPCDAAERQNGRRGRRHRSSPRPPVAVAAGKLRPSGDRATARQAEHPRWQDDGMEEQGATGLSAADDCCGRAD